MKGWREDREVVVAERLHSGDINIHYLPDDFYSDILAIEKYQSASVAVCVEEVTNTENFGSDGCLKPHSFTRFVLYGAYQASFDHTRDLNAAFRVFSGHSG